MKQVSSKRSKTDADFAELAKLEWYASIYTMKNDDGELRICLPSDLIESSLINGAKKQKLGKKAQAGLFVENHVFLNFDGDHLTPDELWGRDENRFVKKVKVQQNSVMRTRFIAENWSVDVDIVYDDLHFNKADIAKIVEDTGFQVGFGDWRPKYGRFEAELL